MRWELRDNPVRLAQGWRSSARSLDLLLRPVRDYFLLSASFGGSASAAQGPSSPLAAFLKHLAMIKQSGQVSLTGKSSYWGI